MYSATVRQARAVRSSLWVWPSHMSGSLIRIIDDSASASRAIVAPNTRRKPSTGSPR